MKSSSEEGSYLRLIDFVYQLESNKEEEEEMRTWDRSGERL